MGSHQCRELEDGLGRHVIGQTDSKTFFAWLDGLSDVERCIADGLRRAREVGDWGWFERYVLAAYRHPSPSYTVVLCEVLDQQGPDVNYEDIVEVLGEIRDPRAIPWLERTKWWEPPWEEYRHLAVKCVWALGAPHGGLGGQTPYERLWEKTRARA